MIRYILCLLLATACGSPSESPVSEGAAGPANDGSAATVIKLSESTRVLSVMGTELSITASHESQQVVQTALDAAIAEIQRVEDLATDWRDSPLMTLNRAKGDGPHAVPPELAQLIEKALLCSELTSGAFDSTFRAVGSLWDFKAKPPRVPSQELVNQTLQKVGYQKVSVDVDAATVTRPEGLWIGLGGIAKGYGVDRAMAVLMEHGIENGIVNAGGDLKALGKNGSELWTIAIRHPRDQQRIIAVLPISNTCVVTSGDYERFFEYNGKRYHHILDPRTGFPSTGAISSTVIAPDAATADALATALCVLPPKAGIELIEQLARVEAMIVQMDGSVLTTTGLQLPESKTSKSGN
ncbi:MAG: FAD:protein FMN transferase [Planctomycetes bacterium]|nr:FAD:protein FMN transferase [Planctomycetota bacterium]